MSVCKAYGAEIVWIKLKSGKSMPCDAQKIPYKMDWHHGKLNLITPEGKLVKGSLDITSDKYGYQSHFATCPMASKFRK